MSGANPDLAVDLGWVFSFLHIARRISQRTLAEFARSESSSCTLLSVSIGGVCALWELLLYVVECFHWRSLRSLRALVVRCWLFPLAEFARSESSCCTLLSVCWHCWLGHISLTRKIVSEMTYIVSSGTLNPTIPYLLSVCSLRRSSQLVSITVLKLDIAVHG